MVTDPCTIKERIQREWNAMVEWCIDMHERGFVLSRGTPADEIAWVDWLMQNPVNMPKWRS